MRPLKLFVQKIKYWKSSRTPVPNTPPPIIIFAPGATVWQTSPKLIVNWAPGFGSLGAYVISTHFTGNFEVFSSSSVNFRSSPSIKAKSSDFEFVSGSVFDLTFQRLEIFLLKFSVIF